MVLGRLNVFGWLGRGAFLDRICAHRDRRMGEVGQRKGSFWLDSRLDLGFFQGRYQAKSFYLRTSSSAQNIRPVQVQQDKSSFKVLGEVGRVFKLLKKAKSSVEKHQKSVFQVQSHSNDHKFQKHKAHYREKKVTE